jgi:hypothetical protein
VRHHDGPTRHAPAYLDSSPLNGTRIPASSCSQNARLATRPGAEAQVDVPLGCMVATPSAINLLGEAVLPPRTGPQIMRVLEVGQCPDEEAVPPTSQDCYIGPTGNMTLTENTVNRVATLRVTNPHFKACPRALRRTSRRYWTDLGKALRHVSRSVAVARAAG